MSCPKCKGSKTQVFSYSYYHPDTGWEEKEEQVKCTKCNGTGEATLSDRERILSVIRSCSHTWDKRFDKDVPSYLRTMADRIERGEL
jgi:hypothetical protein